MKMKNKVLIKVIVPETDDSFDIFIPINEVIWKIKKFIIKGISDLSSGIVSVNDDYCFMNLDTSVIYDNNQIVIDTDIRNATELVLLKINKL